jgi:DNA-binding NarL/FixJ family response regulator
MQTTLLIIEGYEDSLKVAQVRNSIVVDSLTKALTILASSTKIDVIITDTELQDSHGSATISSIREVFDGVLIAAVSCNNYQVGIESVSVGADDFILHHDLNAKAIANIINLSLVRRSFKKTLEKAKNIATIATTK